MDNKSIEELYALKFKELMEQTQVESSIKEEVINTISRYRMMGEFFDLFTAKFIASEATLAENIFGNGD